jgi:hypothetical protein
LTMPFHSFFHTGPIGMIGPVVEGLRVGHQTKDTAGRITYPCNVMD